MPTVLMELNNSCLSTFLTSLEKMFYETYNSNKSLKHNFNGRWSKPLDDTRHLQAVRAATLENPRVDFQYISSSTGGEGRGKDGKEKENRMSNQAITNNVVCFTKTGKVLAPPVPSIKSFIF